MKKTLMGWLLAIPALFGFGLTSCQNDDANLSEYIQSGEKVYVTLEAGLPEDMTRATFAPETDQSPILKFAWGATDVISVVNSADGKWLGNLKVKEINESDKTKCTFDGQIIDPGTDCTLKFYYLASQTLPREGADVQPLTLDFSSQDGTVARFGETDILIASKTYTGGVKGKIGYVGFERDFAYGKFVLKYNKKEIDLGNANVTISAAEGTISNVATLNLQKGEYAYSVKENNSNILLTSPGNNFYVKFFPANKVVLKFTCTVTIDGQEEEFVGTRSTSTGNLVKNLYYTEAGSGLSMIVEMKHSDGRDDERTYKLTYVSNYEGGPAAKSFSLKGTTERKYIVKAYTDVDSFTERPDYVMTGWNTEADGSGDTYEVGSTYTITYPNTEATLYAQWEEVNNDSEVTIALPGANGQEY